MAGGGTLPAQQAASTPAAPRPQAAAALAVAAQARTTFMSQGQMASSYPSPSPSSGTCVLGTKTSVGGPLQYRWVPADAPAEGCFPPRHAAPAVEGLPVGKPKIKIPPVPECHAR